MHTPVSLHRLDKVCERVGLRKSTVYKLLAAGLFPSPVRVSARTSAWRSDEIEAWIDSRQRSPVGNTDGRTRGLAEDGR